MILYTANWCSPCKAIKKKHKELIDSGVIVLKDIDKDEVPKQVRGVPALEDNGNWFVGLDKINKHLEKK